MEDEKREFSPTAGPWWIEVPPRKKRQSAFQKQIEHGKEFIIMTPNKHRAATVDGPSNREKYQECFSNTRLIAAAPTMYRTLKGTVEWLDREIKDIIDCSPSKGTPQRAEHLEELRDDLAETLRKIEEV